MKIVARILAAMLLGGGLTAAVSTNDETPNAVIESAIEQFAVQMDGHREEFVADRQSLYALIDEVLLPRFDREFAARIVLARHWRKASESQRERFVAAFYQALLRRYADGLLEFDQDKVKILPFRGDLSKPRTKVRSTVGLPDGSNVTVSYDLVKRDTGWLLFNVVVEGISYVRNFRAELDSEIRGSSLDATIERLEKEAGITAQE